MEISSDELADLLVEVAKTEVRRQISSRRCPMREPLQHRARTETHVGTKKAARKKRPNFSDKFGHSNCVIVRDSYKLRDLHFHR